MENWKNLLMSIIRLIALKESIIITRMCKWNAYVAKKGFQLEKTDTPDTFLE